MLSRPVQWSLPICAVLSMTLLGCRGSYPLARSVQVTHDPSVEVPPIDGPPQRLATAKPRVGSESARPVTTAGGQLGDQGRVSTAVGHGNSAAANVAAISHLDDSTAHTRNVTSAGTKTMQYAADAARPDATAPASRPFVREGNTQVESIGKSNRSSSPTDSARVDQAELPSDATEMLEAFKNSPPEVQQLALRQLAAAASRRPESTNQPTLASDDPNHQSAIRAVSYESETIEGIVASLNHSTNRSDETADVPDEQGRDFAIHIESMTDRAMTNDSLTKDHAKGESSGASLSLSHTSQSANPAEPPESGEPQRTEVTKSEPPHAQSTLSAPKATTSLEQQLATSTPASPTVTASATAPAPGNAASAPAKSDVATLSESELYAELLGRLGKAAPDETEADRSRRLVMLRHLMVLSGRVDDAVSGIQGMPEKEQEYLRHQLLGLWTIIDPDGHPVPGRRFSAALPQLREATNQLAAATDSLDVRSLAFCTEIEAYGQINKFPSTRFKAGQQVILYCEIDNFVAGKIAEGYETNLQGSYDVFNESGEKVVSQLLPADRQVSNNYLRDYFIAYQMFLPKELAAGSYRLQLTIEDLNGKKYGQSMINFDITR